MLLPTRKLVFDSLELMEEWGVSAVNTPLATRRGMVRATSRAPLFSSFFPIVVQIS